MRLVVVGGGFAGIAAAVALQERRHQVVLLERRGVLGGRATSSRDSVTGEDVDNGTHLMVGAYRATLDLLRRAGADDLLLEQDHLRLEWRDAAGPSVLECPPLVAPLHLLAGLLGFRAPLRLKMQILRLGVAASFGPPPDGLTLAQYLARHGQGKEVRSRFWDPLALGILNETPERAAATLFRDAWREIFLGGSRASRLIFLRRGWGVVAERLASYFEARGGVVRRGVRAERLLVEGEAVCGLRVVSRPRQRQAIAGGAASDTEVVRADAVVCAVPPHALVTLVPEELRALAPFAQLGRFRGSPIVSVEMWLDRQVVDGPMLGLRDCEVEWVFDKGRLYGRSGPPQHLAFVVSAAYRSASKTNAELVGAAEAALRRHFPAMSAATVTRSLVMREPNATFASSPELEALRPGSLTLIRGLFLAGDWTATRLPATIEGAVRSGEKAAAAAEQRLHLDPPRR